MIGNLGDNLVALLADALPTLFGGAVPAVKLSAVGGDFVLDNSSTDVEAGQPRSDEASDTLAFDIARPQGPYRLTRPPDPSVRKVRLTTAAGDRIALTDAEVIFDPADPRNFTLAPRPSRDLSAVNDVLVLYGVTAVFATLKYVQDLSLSLAGSDAAALERAEALTMAVLALNRPGLVGGAVSTESADDYQAVLVVKALHFASGDAPDADTRRILLRAEFEMKAVRALADDEGQPIAHIRSPGSTSTRAVDILPAVDA